MRMNSTSAAFAIEDSIIRSSESLRGPNLKFETEQNFVKPLLNPYCPW